MEYRLENDSSFRLDTLVRFSQCDATGRLSLCELLRLASDAGVENYRLMGLPRDKLEAAGYAILVSRTSFRLHRLPQEGEAVTLETMEEAPEPLLLVRSYNLVGTGGEVLASGVGKWIVVDIASRRIIPTAKFTMRKPFTLKRDRDCLPAGKIAKPHAALTEAHRMCSRKIAWSDLDANGHTNNSRYAEFVMDAASRYIAADGHLDTILSKEATQIAAKSLGDPDKAEAISQEERRITDFRINFNQEATLGQTLAIYAVEEDGRIYIEGRIEGGDKPQVSFEAELVTG